MSEARPTDAQLAALRTFLSFPSISAQSEHRADTRACAEWLASHLTDCGLENARLYEIPDGNPLVYGQRLDAGPDAPTVLVYGHYDVQPVDPIDHWTNPPFEPTERDGRAYARGASDNKGQIIANTAAVAELMADGGLPCNVKMLFEGEEELRADRFATFVERETELLACDLALICDVAMHAEGVPSVPLGLRGQCSLRFKLRTAREDLHSGLYGGAVPNSLHAISELLATLHDADGRVTVDGFYDGIEEIPDVELSAWRLLPSDPQALEVATGSINFGEPEYSTVERLWARPTLELHGVHGGYAGTALKTVIPAEAWATLSCRLVPGQSAERILELVIEHLDSNLPAGAEIDINWTLIGAQPILTSADHPAVACALSALEEAFGEHPVLTRMGWSVPAAEILQRALESDVLLLGFALPDEQAHAPDEHFSLDHLARGIQTMVGFWRRLASSPVAATAAY
jgi:acetylornithine deacetylase/succinyl-diaminopimelate desuccinylase-like protein